MAIEMNNDRAWLERMAGLEEYESVSAGGLYIRMLEGQRREVLAANGNLSVLGRLVELARRKKGFSVAEVAEKCKLGLDEVLAIEQGGMDEPEPRILFTLAKELDLPAEGLMELGGLVQKRDNSLGKAAVRFAANCKPTAKLTRAEKDALDEFVKVLAHNAQGG